MNKRLIIVVAAILAFLIPATSFAAIAFDAVTTNQVAGGTGLTYAHTVTGSDTILIVGASTLGGTGDVLTSITYNGVAMTRINTQPISTTERLYLYYLIAPTTGTNNVVLTTSASVTKTSSAASYTGAKQSSQPDASNSGETAGTSLSVSVTTVADNSWIIAYARRNLGGTADVSAGTIDRGDLNVHDFSIIETQANPITPAGADSVDISSGTSFNGGIVAASIAPAVAAPAATAPTMKVVWWFDE